MVFVRIFYPKQTNEHAKLRTAIRRESINRFKDKPCTDCGVSYPPYVMDFDHVWGEKVAAISQMITWAWEDVQTEMAKCEVVCSNCHRQRTHERFLGRGSAAGKSTRGFLNAQ